jgi:uncharacterized protein
MFRKSPEHKVCPACLEADEAAYARIAGWLSEHPGATLQEVAEATAVEEKVVLRLLRDGRLAMLEHLHADDHPRCRRCDTRIARGVMCGPCAEIFGASLTDSAQSLRQSAAPRSSRVRGPLSREEKRDGDSSSS